MNQFKHSSILITVLASQLLAVSMSVTPQVASGQTTFYPAPHDIALPLTYPEDTTNSWLYVESTDSLTAPDWKTIAGSFDGGLKPNGDLWLFHTNNLVQEYFRVVEVPK